MTFYSLECYSQLFYIFVSFSSFLFCSLLKELKYIKNVKNYQNHRVIRMAVLRRFSFSEFETLTLVVGFISFFLSLVSFIAAINDRYASPVSSLIGLFVSGLLIFGYIMHNQYFWIGSSDDYFKLSLRLFLTLFLWQLHHFTVNWVMKINKVV